MWASMRGRTSGKARLSRFLSATKIATTWRQRPSMAPKTWVSASRNGRIGRRTASPKWARMRASSLSFLASWPVDLAKSRSWRGLTTATGNAAAAKDATKGGSKPPVASRITAVGSSTRNLATSVSSPASSYCTLQFWSSGRASGPPGGRRHPPYPWRHRCRRR